MRTQPVERESYFEDSEERVLELPQLFCIKGPFSGSVTTVYTSPFVLGRGEDCHLVLDDVSISRNHARITVEGDQYLIEDLESTNGTLVNGTRINGLQKVTHNDVILLGSIAFKFIRKTSVELEAFQENTLLAYQDRVTGDNNGAAFDRYFPYLLNKAKAHSLSVHLLAVEVGQGESENPKKRLNSEALAVKASGILKKILAPETLYKADHTRFLATFLGVDNETIHNRILRLCSPGTNPVSEIEFTVGIARREDAQDIRSTDVTTLLSEADKALGLAQSTGGQVFRYFLSNDKFFGEIPSPGRMEKAQQQPHFTSQLLVATEHNDLKIYQVQKWLDENYHMALHIAALAKQFYFGERNLNKRFKKATGYSPKDYIQKLRMERACYYLENTGLPVITIAQSVGYSDAAAFSKAFRKVKGLSPKAYRTGCR